MGSHLSTYHWAVHVPPPVLFPRRANFARVIARQGSKVMIWWVHKEVTFFLTPLRRAILLAHLTPANSFHLAGSLCGAPVDRPPNPFAA